MAPNVRKQLRLYPLKPSATVPDGHHNRVLAAAIYQDLLNLAEAAHDKAKDPPVVLLLDDVHRFGPGALRFLVENLLVSECLSGPRNHIPVVMAFSTAGRKLEYGPSAKDLAEFPRGQLRGHPPAPGTVPLPDPNRTDTRGISS